MVKTELLFLFILYFILFEQAAVLLAEEPLYVHQIVIHPEDRQTIYASTDNQGVLKSSDGGKTWKLINQGIKSYLLYQLVVDHKRPEILYLGSWGGGVYRSLDGGTSWSERNYGLENTAVRSLILHTNAETVYLATSTGVYKGINNGESWTPINTGLYLIEWEVPQCMILLPSEPATLLLGTNKGVYEWKETDSNWSKMKGYPAVDVTAFAYDMRTRLLYSGTIDQGIYTSHDGGRSWDQLKGLEKVWVNEIAFHPLHAETIYVMTRDRGILKTEDSGKSWTEINNGIEDRWVTTLSFDPVDPETLYAGTHEQGIYESDDGGNTWKPLLSAAIQSSVERNKALSPTPIPSKEGIVISPPPEGFKKCNECHGWTDYLLNSHSPTYFRMAANNREWTVTVKRMSQRAQLLPEEERDIIRHLNTYYGLKDGKGGDMNIINKEEVKSENGLDDKR